MKRSIIFLTIIIALLVSACGGQGDPGNATGESPQESKVEIADALTLLNTIWAGYGEEEKFPASGGDYSGDNSIMDAPGNFGVGDAAALDSVLGLPEDAATKIDGAASLMHMMNANTFTCGAFHVKDPEGLSSVADSLKDNILNRQWMCGFPDKLIVMTVGDYVISAFGDEEIINTFKDKAIAAYGSATLVYEEPIV